MEQENKSEEKNSGGSERMTMFFIGAVAGAIILFIVYLIWSAIDERNERIENAVRQTERNSGSISVWAGRVLELEKEVEKIRKENDDDHQQEKV